MPRPMKQLIHLCRQKKVLLEKAYRVCFRSMRLHHWQKAKNLRVRMNISAQGSHGLRLFSRQRSNAICTVIGARMSHWKWIETKQHPSRARSGCCLVPSIYCATSWCRSHVHCTCLCDSLFCEFGSLWHWHWHWHWCSRTLKTRQLSLWWFIGKWKPTLYMSNYVFINPLSIPGKIVEGRTRWWCPVYPLGSPSNTYMLHD